MNHRVEISVVFQHMWMSQSSENWFSLIRYHKSHANIHIITVAIVMEKVAAVCQCWADRGDNPWTYFPYPFKDQIDICVLWILLEIKSSRLSYHDAVFQRNRILSLISISDWSIHSENCVFIRLGSLPWAPIANCAGNGGYIYSLR